LHYLKPNLFDVLNALERFASGISRGMFDMARREADHEQEDENPQNRAKAGVELPADGHVQ
jgi:hypothetical protein